VQTFAVIGAALVLSTVVPFVERRHVWARDMARDETRAHIDESTAR
jgi:hypothetical protein